MELYKDKTMPVEKRVDDLLARMSMEEKIGQLNQVPLIGNLDELKAVIRDGNAGSVILAYTPLAGSEYQPDAVIRERREMQRIAVEETRLGIPLLLGRDVIHGHHTIFPVPLAQAASWDADTVREASNAMAVEAAMDGIHWTFAPVVDVSRDPRWGRIIEGFGEDPYLSSVMASAGAEGVLKGGLTGCAKHFIGYGALEGGRDYNGADIPDYTLYNIYLPSFRAAFKAGIQTVMSSFNDINGEPVTASYRLLTRLLKEICGFDGFVVSDWASVEQLVEQGVARDNREAAELAFNAGVDMDMASGCYLRYLPGLLKDGRVSARRLDDAVRRILRVKFRGGLFEQPYAGQPNDSLYEKHAVIARKLSAGSMVLLKNSNHILPLRSKDIKIALIGPMGHERRTHLGHWTLDGREENVVSIAHGIKSAAPEAAVLTVDSCLYDDMISLARKADIVVVAIGESRDRTGEAHSVARLSLSTDQEWLVEAVSRMGRPVVTVVCAGRPVGLERIAMYSQAILYAWHGGTQAGAAIGDILFGKVNPEGKLPITFPRCAGQIPVYYNHRATGRKIDEYYGDAQYNNYDDCPGSPMYPFGYGLQYTEYQYGPVQSSKSCMKRGDTIQIETVVTNTGNMAGTETVQCYMGRKCSGTIQPVRELKAFKRLYLESGESQAVVFTFNYDELGFYDPYGAYIVKPGTYTFWVGGSSLTSNSVVLNVE